jgi:preprotein translocase subunit SecG
MTFQLYASLLGVFFGWMMALLSIFLILLVLVQRGRGGGLAGALGGPGGQSAFGSKAGDMFTKVTFTVAGVWIALCALAMFSLGDARNAYVEEQTDSQVRQSRFSEEAGEVPANTTDDERAEEEDDATAPGLGSLDALNETLEEAAEESAGEEGAEAGAEATPAEEPAAADDPGAAEDTAGGSSNS